MARVGTRLVGLLAAVIVAGLSFVVNPHPAYACECVSRSTARSLRDADAVFRGTLTETDTVRQDGVDRVDLRFEVDLVYKGTVFADQVVATPADGPNCGMTPEVGTRWIIFARNGIQGSGEDAVARLVTDVCGGNLAADKPPALLGPGEPPRPGPSDREERSTRTDERLTRGLVIGGFGLLGALVLGGVLVALAWRPGTRP